MDPVNVPAKFEVL